MKLNRTTRNRVTIRTHEGAPANRVDAEQQLRRSIMSCMLWEGEFYESGESIASRIAKLVPLVPADMAADIAVEARNQMKLRHVPLLVAREMARASSDHKALVAAVLGEIIQRPDELTEFLAIYWKDGKQPISKQTRLGLAEAFQKFDEYALAKYNRDGAIKLRDVLFLTHPKPLDDNQQLTWNRLVNNQLAIPDTWENRLSAGEDKKAAFTDLLNSDSLGALALLRNLRNMIEAGVNDRLIKASLKTMNPSRVLPFRFISAARYAPQFTRELEDIMLRCLDGLFQLDGTTTLLVDVSGSMDEKISGKSELRRMDAAAGLAILLRELAQDVNIRTFSNSNVPISKHFRGFGLGEAIVQSQPHGGTYLGAAITQVVQNCQQDRLIVITDEQSHDRIPEFTGVEKSYMINVASNKNGVGYKGDWNHIDGWSEAIVDYIHVYENTPL